MKKFKKLLAGIMTLAMLVTMLPATVLAAGTTVEVATQEELQAAINDPANVGNIIKIKEGTYTVPSMKAGITLEGEVKDDGTPAVLLEGTFAWTNFEDNTLKNLHIKGGNAQRWAYAKGDLLFENVTFEATSVYALHFDGIAEGTNLTYKDCTIIGWAAMGGSPASCVFDGCTIKDNGTYGVIRTYFDATIKNCTFDVDNANLNDGYQDGIHAVDATVKVENCTNANGDMMDIVHKSGTGMVTVNGVEMPKGTITIGYTAADRVWGEGTSNSTKSFVVKLYAEDEEIASTSLKNYEGIIDGDIYVTWGIPFDGSDSNYWDVEWKPGHPNANAQPTKVVLYADGKKVAENVVQMNAPDNLNPVEWKELDAVQVAEVNGVKYADLQEAIVAAAPNGTVNIISDVEVDKWVMISERLSIGNGKIITCVIDGMTINGNGHTLTVNSIESAGNGNRLFYDATNLNINGLTIEYANGVVGGIGLKSGTIDNVTFIGGKAGVLPGNGEVIIKNSTFKTNGSAIYYEEARDNLTVTGNTFDIGENNYVIYLRGNEIFTDNEIISGKVNVVSGSPTVTDNTFEDGMRFKVYNDATAKIEDNTLTYVVFDEEGVPVQSTFAGNILSDEAQAALNAAGVVNVMPVEPTPSKGGSTSKIYKAEINTDDIENGSIKLSHSKAKKGATVTITAIPDAGYELDKLVVLDKDGNEVELKDKGDGKFTFKMPRGGVEVDASFAEADAVVAKDTAKIVLTIDSIVALVNGEPVVNDVAPIIKGERTFLPIRLIAEELGATVTWNETEQSVTILKDDMTIVIYIGQAFALVNGEPVQLDAPAFIENGRTYLPLRFVAENLGAVVTWDGLARTVTIVAE